MNRLNALREVEEKFKAIDEFINQTGADASINVIDPEYNQFHKLAGELEYALAWIKDQIEAEESELAETINDNNEPHGWRLIGHYRSVVQWK